jgi:hypothetical protein
MGRYRLMAGKSEMIRIDAANEYAALKEALSQCGYDSIEHVAEECFVEPGDVFIQEMDTGIRFEFGDDI